MKKTIAFFVAGVFFAFVGEMFLFQVFNVLSSGAGFIMMGIGAALVLISFAINFYRKRNYLPTFW